MKVQILASGSKGNSTLVETETTKILIDLGINYRQLKNRLDYINLSPHDINGVIITHTHTDHIGGVASFVAKTGAKVYSANKNYSELSKVINEENIEIINGSFSLGNLNITIFNLSHDVPVIGLLIKENDTELVYITDTGYINKKYYEQLKNKDIYILESNYDEEMLLNGPYPQLLKQRVIGDSGHLSNKMSAKFLSKVIGEKTKYIYLAHISENNNTPALAYDTVATIIKEKGFNIDKLLVANQHEISEIIEVNDD